MTEARQLTCRETVTMLRAALKKSFPGVKFSVRTSRSLSVNVTWTDGPTLARVQAVAGLYEGCTFDGMTDSRVYHDPVEINGEQVKAGTDFVFCTRLESDLLIANAIAIVGAQITVEDFKRGVNIADERRVRNAITNLQF